jgi:hypothetical protein
MHTSVRSTARFSTTSARNVSGTGSPMIVQSEFANVALIYAVVITSEAQSRFFVTNWGLQPICVSVR